MKVMSFLLLAIPAAAFAQKTASVIVNGDSVQIQPSSAQFVAGVGNVTAFFTTYNGSGSPLINSDGNVSGEIRPRTGAAGTYEGGYVVATQVAIIDYGSYAISVPTTDADGDGTPDLLQFDKAGNFSATGSGLSVPANSTFSITVTFSRAANSATGSYSARTQNATTTTTYTGVYNLSSFVGTVSYTRGSTNTMVFTLTSRVTGTLLTGSTTYTTANSNQLSYAAFTARDLEGNSYQFLAGALSRTGSTYRGDLSLVDGLPQTYWADFTKYRLTINDSNDSNGDGVPDLTDPSAILAAPSFTTQPQSQTVNAGANVTFTAAASGSPTFQWRKDGTAINGATNATLTLTSVTTSNAGTYTVVATNSTGTTTSSNAVLTVNTPQGAAPTITVQPLSQTVAPGGSATFTVTATGPGALSYQWYKNGTAIAGATGASYSVASAAVGDAGTYTVAITSSQGTVTSSSAVMTVGTNSASRLANLSARAQVGTGGDVLIVGFIMSGSGSKQLLLRGVGPTLGISPYNLPGVLAKPALNLFDANSNPLPFSNTGWGGGSTLSNAFNSVGAFALPAASADDAILVTLPAANYTAQVSGVNSTSGVALAEIYDTEGPNSATRLANISARAQVGTGGNILIAGFIISGTTPKQILIRATGPALAALGVPGTLSDPRLDVYSGSTVVQSNDNWGDNAGAAALGAAFAKVGAFPLSDTTSKDAALLITLSPGGYTAQVSGVNGTNGVALIELYEMP